MKKIILMAIVLICSIATMNCEAKPSTRKQIKELEKKKELELKRQEFLRDSIKAARQLEKEIRGYDNDLNSTELVENTFLHTPCLDESIDTDEYMAGLGISAPKNSESLAMRTAREAALADITARYLGVIKSGVSDFVKETNTRDGNIVSEGDVEGMAVAVGEKAINKFAEVACRRLTKTKKGSYICYMAVHVRINEVVSEIAQNMAVNQVNRDKQKFLDYMEKELTKQASKQEADELRQQKIQENKELLESINQ